MKTKLATGLWWRFSDYEVSDGYVRPAAGATLTTYDPWSAWNQAKPIRQGRPTPYQDLFAIIGDQWHPEVKSAFTRHLHFPTQLDESTRERLLGWCRKYGLLGIFPHRATHIFQPPGPWRASRAAARGVLAPSNFTAQQLYTRTGTGWQLNELSRGTLTPGVVHFEKIDPNFFTGSGNALFSPFSQFVHYFPVKGIVDKNWHLPLPLSEAFWRDYCEPLPEFLATISVMRSAIASLRTKGPRSGMKSFTRELGLKAFNSFLGSVSPAAALHGRDGVRQTWSASSLIGSLSMMALSDAPEGKLIECVECHTLFVSTSPQSKYHSEQCRWRALKRRQRRQ